MPYTYKSLAFAWLIIFALFAVSASGAARGWWFVLLLALAAVPALVLRSPVDVATRSPQRPLVLADKRERSPLDLVGIDVLQWENEGGAPGIRLRDRFREPVTATS